MAELELGALRALRALGPSVVALALCVGVSGVAGCSSDGSHADSGQTQGGPTGSDAGRISCAMDPRVTPYTPGMKQTGTAGYTFAIVSTDPTPLAVPATNSLVLKITDPEGQPVEGATFKTLKAWMPDHTHGWTGIKATANGDGTYAISNVYLVMGGVWQFTFEANMGAVTDKTVFTLCVGG